MRCPFLHEVQVKTCQASAIKKMIARAADDVAHERCSSPDYVNCPSLKQHQEEHPDLSHCLFLSESLAQYCAALPATKYLPYREPSALRCGTDNHLYCELYSSVAAPENIAFNDRANTTTGMPSLESWVQGYHVPRWLAFAPTHMWLDRTSDGSAHLGVDAFLAHLLRHIDAINFVTSKGRGMPTIALTVHGVDLQLVFPFLFDIDRVNSRLRADPQQVTLHPYTSGWFFEGTFKESEQTTGAAVAPSTLMRGEVAREWMKREVRHLTEFIHNQIVPDRIGGQSVLADGGLVDPDVLDHLNRQELQSLFNEFFSLSDHWSNTSI